MVSMKPGILDYVVASLGGNVVPDLIGNLSVLLELHRVICPTLGHRPQVGGVAKHFSQRHNR